MTPTTIAYNSYIFNPIPGFTAEQTTSLQAIINISIKAAIEQAIEQAISQAITAFETRLTAIKAKFPPTKYQVIAQQQLIVEKTAEKPTEKTAEKQSIASSSDNDNTGTLSTIPHQATMHYCRESSPRLNGAPLSTLASQLASQLASPPDYIHYGKGIEATDQGQRRIRRNSPTAYSVSLASPYLQRGRCHFSSSVAFVTDSSTRRPDWAQCLGTAETSSTAGLHSQNYHTTHTLFMHMIPLRIIP